MQPLSAANEYRRCNRLDQEVEARLVLPERLNLRGFPGPLCSSYEHRKSLLSSFLLEDQRGWTWPTQQCPLIAVVGNHPIFRWFASLYLFKLSLRMHPTSQGLILSQCSKQQHHYSDGMSKFDHQFWTAADRNSILRYHTRNSARQS